VPPLAADTQRPNENVAAPPAPSNPQDQPPSLPTAAAIEAQAAVLPVVPTLTITPVPLGQVGADSGAQPVATLFPTTGAVAEAPLAAFPPILMYHYIRVVDQAADPLGYNLSITPDDFERQIAWLHDQGYAGVRMDTLARCMRGEARCPPKPLALTFDDGYEDAFSAALPVLQRYGFTATFYIVNGFVGHDGYMSWEQIVALRDAGMEIGAHTIDHLDLRTLDPAEAARQIAQSKADLERDLGISITSFCYPGGFYDPAIEEMVRAAGYLSATTTRWDFDYSDMMALPRRRIAGGITLDEFAATVQG
jgi:peptidoglycan/xylan/chitin deacetylase (PgdA/CDA1 family)